MTQSTKKKTTKPKRTLQVKTLPELPTNPFIFEILDLASRQRSKAKKIEVLRKYDHKALRHVLIWNFDEAIVSILPEGEVPYVGYDENVSYSGSLTTKLSHQVRSMHEKGNFSLGAGDQQGHTTIRRESKHFYRFVKGGDDAMNKIKRESVFINILQTLPEPEAEILVLVKDKLLTTKYNITKELVAEAYPEITWGNRS